LAPIRYWRVEFVSLGEEGEDSWRVWEREDREETRTGIFLVQYGKAGQRVGRHGANWEPPNSRKIYVVQMNKTIIFYS
jgi:hypothetical protein